MKSRKVKSITFEKPAIPSVPYNTLETAKHGVELSLLENGLCDIKHKGREYFVGVGNIVHGEYELESKDERSSQVR